MIGIFSAIEEAQRRDDVVGAYASEIRAWHGYPTALTIPHWQRVNQAIIEKWSESGLRYIKDRAWKAAAASSGEDAQATKGKGS